MAERMTSVRVAGAPAGTGFADYGRCDPLSMIQKLREHAARDLAVAKRVLAARDHEFIVETYVGIHVQRQLEQLWPLAEETEGAAFANSDPGNEQHVVPCARCDAASVVAADPFNSSMEVCGDCGVSIGRELVAEQMLPEYQVRWHDGNGARSFGQNYAAAERLAAACPGDIVEERLVTAWSSVADVE